MLVVNARVQARPDTADELASLLAPLAAVSRRDPGCLSYEFYRDLEDPTLFCSVETWTTRTDLDEHLGAPHTAQLLAALPPLVAGPPSITAHEVSSSDRVA